MLITLNVSTLVKSPVLPMDYNGIYKAVSELFRGEEQPLVRCVINGNLYCWDTPGRPGEVWLTLGEADTADRKAVGERIRIYRERIKTGLGLAQEGADALFSTPDDGKFILFSRTGGRLRIAVTAWGYAYKSGYLGSDGKPVLLPEDRKPRSSGSAGSRGSSGRTGNTGSDGSDHSSHSPHRAPRKSQEPPKKPRKAPGNPVRNAPKPYIPDPAGIIDDPARKCRIYGNTIFAIIDPEASRSRQPLDDFCRQFAAAYPHERISSHDDFCNMVIMTVHASRREWILSDMRSRIKDVEFYCDAVAVFAETDAGGAHADDDRTWHLRAVGAEMAHRRTQGDPRIKVAVIDSYFDLDHPALKGLRIESPLSLEDGTDNVAPPAPETDRHGTHVLGIIGAACEGFTGMAPKCTFIPISVGSSPTSVVLMQGVLYAINKGATVINVSMGMMMSEEDAAKLSLDDQIAWWRSVARGAESVWDYVYGMLDRRFCTIVWSAGNENLFELMDSSKRYDGIIRVDAVDRNLRKAEFSNFGNVDLKVNGKPVELRKSVVSAPGVGIYSTVPGDGWRYLTGTSMAAPTVTGAVALVKSLDATLTNSQVIDLIRCTAVPVRDASIGPLLRIDRTLDALTGGMSRWDDFRSNPAGGGGVWKKVNQTTYVDTDTLEFKYYGQNYLIFESRGGGVIEVHEVGRDSVYNARFKADWGRDEVILDITPPFASASDDTVILTSRIRLFRDTDGSIGFEVLLPEHVSRSHLRRLETDDRVNTTKRKI